MHSPRMLLKMKMEMKVRMRIEHRQTRSKERKGIRDGGTFEGLLRA
jgi:hypothetical protein